MSSFAFHDLIVPASGYGRVALPVTRMAGGYPVTIPLHVAHGAKPGPKVLLLAAVHGEEIFAVDVIRRVLREVDRTSLRGTIMAIPVGNPPSLEWRTRNTPVDMLNMNRVFPGKAGGWLSERMAAVISEVVRGVNVVIDIDGGSAERVIHYVYVKESTDAVGRQVEELSRVFGLELLYRGPFFDGSVSSYAQDLGIPCIVPEVGGSFLYLDGRFLDQAVAGVMNVMRHLGMLDGAPVKPLQQYMITDRVLIRVPQGGIFHPLVGVESLNRPLRRGTPLGSIMDPYTLEDVATMTAPWDDSVLLQMRVLVSAVHPGDYAYIIGNRGSAERL
jgi:predicted deacylase